MPKKPHHPSANEDTIIHEANAKIAHLRGTGWIRLQPAEREPKLHDINPIMRKGRDGALSLRAGLPSSAPRYHVAHAMFPTRILRRRDDAITGLGLECWYRIELTPDAREASLAAATCGRRPS